MYFAIYKLNAYEAHKEYAEDYFAESEEPYNPTKDGRCFMYDEDDLTMWMAADDWYLMIKIREDSIATPYDYLLDAYETINQPDDSRNPTLIFENDVVM